MERTKYLIIVLFFWVTALGAQTNHKTSIYDAYISNDMGNWKSTIDKMQEKTNKTNSFLLKLTNYQYGYIAWCLGNEKEKEAKKYLKLAKKNIEILEKRDHNLSMVNAYKSAFIGFMIGLNVMKAPFIGTKSIEFAERAVEKNRENAFAYVQLGNIHYYTPEMFGGSKQKAIDYYEKSELLMESDNTAIKNAWDYLNLLVIIAQAHQENEKYALAKDYYEKILTIEPQFLWVKNELYPELLTLID